MEKQKQGLGKKVIIGFLLAIFIVISVSLVTYISIRNLLDTVENLSKPNERLRQLNGLIADIYHLDASRGDRTSDRDSLLQQALDRIQYRLGWLSNTSDDKTESESLEKINDNVRELLIGYAGLEEIRLNLTNNIFSDKALKSIETKIQRRQQLDDLDFLQRLQNRSFFSDVIPRMGNAEPREPSKNKEVLKNNELQGMDQNELLTIAKNLEQLNLKDSKSGIQKSNSDSLLLVLRKLLTQIYRDEQKLRNSFIDLEDRLSTKNKEIFSEIQGLVGAMQQSILVEYREQNKSAYALTYRVSNILAFLVFLGVIGSLGFVYSILKEVRQANSYRVGLEEAKQYSDKLAKAKQDFLSNMSHEIRNPLHAIQGYQHALSKSGLQPDQKEFVEMIGFASATLMGIVNDILDFSKLEAGKIHIEQEPFEPLKLFFAIQSFFAFKAAEKGLGFHWDIDLPKGKWLIGDQLRLNQIMNNLLSNALKFTHKGEINVSVKVKSNKIYLKIRDTGMGMTEDVKQNIFQEFNQGDTSVTRKFGGTGLGLAIVKKLVEVQGGGIKVQSKPENGTEINIQLPTKIVDPALYLEMNELDFTYSLAGLHILVVDDDPIGIKLIKLLLETNGAQVTTYFGGLDFQKNYIPKPMDMAILDIQMPEVSGFEVLEILKKIPIHQTLPTIAMTANVFVDEKHKITEGGFDGLILKPFKEDQIIEKIGKILNLPKLPLIEKTALINFDAGKYDLQDLSKFCMGDEELLLDIISDLVEITFKNLKNMEQALQSGDLTTIREICHQLSSRLAQIRVPIAEKAKDIEVAIKNRNTEGIEGKVKDFMAECFVVVEKIALDFKIVVPS